MNYTSIILHALVIAMFLAEILCNYVPAQHQNEFNGFLQMIEDENNDARSYDPDNELNMEFFYKNGYSIDRNGLPFVKCQERTSKNQTKSRTIRCGLAPPVMRPSCFAMYDYDNDFVRQGCTHYKPSEAEFCEDNGKKCSDREADAMKVGYCCCTGNHCNGEVGRKHRRRF